MSPVSHLLVGWLTANTMPLDRRERLLITFSGIAPDIDGLGIIADWLTKNSSTPLQWWGDYHHLLGHNIAIAALLAMTVFLLAGKQKAAACLSLVSYHLHLFCDLLGSRGPDGYQWPIPYLWPFSSSWQWAWEGQWALNSWQNMLITAASLAATFYLAWKNGFSPLEFFSSKADRKFSAALHERFGKPNQHV
ncbi:metal-dependent hydrolase [Desulfobulbus sp. F3]|nr:metal-dependent hydrolase [Desulfobulbus sp. F3]